MPTASKEDAQAAPRGRPPRRGTRLSFHPSLLFLLLGVALLLAIAYQAQTAVRSHRATVDQVLADYAATAAWGFDQRISAGGNSEIADMLELLFHPLHGAHPKTVRSELPPASSVFYPAGACHPDSPWGCIRPIPFAMRFPLSGGEGEVVGYVPAGFHLERVRAEVRRHVRTNKLLQRTEAALGMRLAGRPHLVGYSRQLGVTDTLLYVLALDSAAVAPVFRSALLDRLLLPEPLVRDKTNGELLTVVVGVEGGGTIFQSGPLPATAETRTRKISSAIPGLSVSVALHEAAAGKLIVGGPPVSRLPLLLGLLVLASSLLIVGLVQLRREQALARMRSEFVASVSHELRTPLALQRVFLDMLKLGRVRSEEERRWSIETIDRETVRLMHLVENVLQFSRAEQSQMRVVPAPGELSDVVRDAADAFAPLAQPAGTGIKLHLEKVTVPVDGAALRQVVMNLLENAVKYGPEGQTVTVTLERRGDTAVLTIDDEGPGIREAEREVVFEPFRRGDGTFSTAVAGSGIGLAIVHEIVRLHGGSIGVESAPSGGARLRIVLPGAQAAGIAAVEGDEQVYAHPASVGGYSHG
jgi:signal transduction histidine kinase